MGKYTLHEGTENEFVVEYLDAGLRFKDGENDLRSGDFESHTMTAFELSNINQYYQPNMSSTFTGSADASNPISGGNMNNYVVSDTGGDSVYFSNAVGIYATSDDSGNAHIITKISDLQRLLWIPYVSKSSSYGVETYYIYTNDYGTYSHMYVLDKNGTKLYSDARIRPVWLAPLDNTKAVFCPTGQTVASWFAHVGYRGSDSGKYKSQYTYSGDYVRLNSGVYFPTMGTHTITRTDGNQIHTAELSADGNYALIFDGRLNPEWVATSDEFGVKIALHTESEMLFWLATFGYMFEYDGKRYKPIVEGGYVTGYTDDMNKKSEWDNWHDISDHEVPTVPPKHKTDNDGIDDMTLGFTSYGNGFINYYIMTSGQLTQLVTEMSNQTEFPNLMNNIVSLKSYACELNGMYSGSVADVKVGQFQTAASGIKINTTDFVKTLATFTIKGAHGTISKPHFLDYPPYTRLEVYIPFCGTVPLPPEVMYNTITVSIITDIVSGSCTGVVKCNGNIVAQKAGVIGTDVPLASNDSASQNNAFMQGMLNTAQAGAKTIASGATGNVGGIVANGLSALGSSLNTTMTMNDNYTHVIGTQGDKSSYAMPKECYLKRYRTIDLSDDNYTATIGRPVCKRRALASGDGFTVCDNPRINGNMTLAEKAEIEAYLRTGVIL